MEEKERKEERINEAGQVYHSSHVAMTFIPKDENFPKSRIPKQHSRDCHIECFTIVLSKNTPLGLPEYELLRNSYAI